MLGLCYAKVLNISTYNPKNEKGEKDLQKFNYRVKVFDTGLLNGDFEKDTDLTKGDFVELFISSEQNELIDKVTKLAKYSNCLITFDLQGNYKELLAIDLVKSIKKE